MRHSRLVLAASFVVVVALAPGAGAQTTSADVEIGYQWVDVSGNEDMQRTQLNEDSGFVLNDLSVVVIDADGEIGLLDRLRVSASGFGGSPAGRFRLTSDLDGVYSLTLDYRQYELFSALPGWANPRLSEGVTPGLHTWERDRHMMDLEIEILPGRAITPIVGYRFNEVDGPRRTTYHEGQDEWILRSELEETEEELRIGAAFRLGTFRGAVIQGWRDFESTDTADLAAGAGGGVNDRPVLGRDVSADSLRRTTRSEVDTPVTTAYLSGATGDGTIRLSASYVYADAELDTSSDELLAGSLVSYRISRFFDSLEQSVESRTENPSWRGAVRTGIDLSRKLTLDVGFERAHRELEGWALISDLYLGTFNFSGADPRDVSELVEIDNSYEREEDVLDATLSVRDLGPFRAWAGWALRDISVGVNQDAAQIILPFGQEGSYDREVESLNFGVGVDAGDLKILLDYVSDDADAAVVRTDFLDRERTRARFDWAPCPYFAVLGTIERITADNHTPDLELDADTDHWAVDLDIHPLEAFSLRLAWDRYETDSTLTIRRPQDFGLEPSLHSEDGEVLEGSIQWRVTDPLSLTAGYSTLENDGSLPFELDRAFARLAYDFSSQWGASLEYEANEYAEQGFEIADFDADRIGVFVRWRYLR